jgi:DNA-binding NtrC family response regulator
MATLWIVHREPSTRIAIARLAAVEESVLGGPADPVFDAAPAADVVVLGLGGDLEPELQFAHRTSRRLQGAAFILLAEGNQIPQVRRLFDTLECEILSYPPDAAALRDLIRAAPARRRGDPLPLSQRPARDSLASRFGRAFADLDLPQLLRALDPQLVDVPMLIEGEPGTGRALLARYVHSFSETASGPLAEVLCTPHTTPAEIVTALGAAARDARPRVPGSVCLYELERLTPAVQRRVHTWIEFAPPAGALQTRVTRWIGTVRDPGGLDPGLRQTLSGLQLRIPPLRDRPGAVAGVAQGSVDAWCQARGERARELSDDAIAALEEYPWPGNLRELEAVIVQSLSAGIADPLTAADLRYQGQPFVPRIAEPAGATDPTRAPFPEEWRPGEPEEFELEIEEIELPDEMPIAQVEPEEEPEIIDATPWLEPSPAEAAAADLEEEPAVTELELPAPDRVEPVVTLEEAATSEHASLPRLARAVAHEVRNPLTSIRSFAQLLSERHEDPEFREQFAKLVNQDTQRIEDVLRRLDRLAALAPPARAPVDVSAILQRILNAHRASIRERRLVVLQELDLEQPMAVGDADQLDFAFESLLDKSLRLVPEGGDLYIASKHHEAGVDGKPFVRVLLRLRGPEPASAGDGAGSKGGRQPVIGLSSADHALELAIAETVVRAHGGALAVDTSDGEETVIVLDLPA